jgi:hypothetical protein
MFDLLIKVTFETRFFLLGEDANIAGFKLIYG